MNKISLIVPIYNVDLYIKDCINSIINQTYSNLEVLLIDDCGTDNSMNIVYDIIKEYQGPINFKIIHHIHNKGLSAARNTGLLYATGKYISFVDSDDYIDKNMFAILLSTITSNPQFGIVSCINYRDHEGKIIPSIPSWEFTEPRIIYHSLFAETMLTQKSCNAVWGKLYKADLLHNIKFREGKINEDILFMYDLSSVIESIQVNVIEIPHHLYYYRQRSNSICSSISNPLIIAEIQNLEDIIKDCTHKNKDLANTLYDIYFTKLFSFIYNLILNKDDVFFKKHIHNHLNKLKMIPNRYVRNKYGILYMLRFMTIKYTPFLYIYLKRYFIKISVK